MNGPITSPRSSTGCEAAPASICQRARPPSERGSMAIARPVAPATAAATATVAAVQPQPRRPTFPRRRIVSRLPELLLQLLASARGDGGVARRVEGRHGVERAAREGEAEAESEACEGAKRRGRSPRGRDKGRSRGEDSILERGGVGRAPISRIATGRSWKKKSSSSVPSARCGWGRSASSQRSASSKAMCTRGNEPSEAACGRAGRAWERRKWGGGERRREGQYLDSGALGQSRE